MKGEAARVPGGKEMSPLARNIAEATNKETLAGRDPNKGRQALGPVAVCGGDTPTPRKDRRGRLRLGAGFKA